MQVILNDRKTNKNTDQYMPFKPRTVHLGCHFPDNHLLENLCN